MPLSPQHKKRFGVYHWDTFDNETLFVRDFDTQAEAEKWIREEGYEGRVRPSGADKVDIVDKESAEIVLQFSVG